MAKVYNQSGCIDELIAILKENRIYDFETLKEIDAFRSNYKSNIDNIRQKSMLKLRASFSDLEKARETLLARIDNNIQEEDNSLKANLVKVNKQITKLKKSKNIIENILSFFKKRELLQKKRRIEESLENEQIKLSTILDSLKDKKDNPERWIEKYSRKEIAEQERIVSVFKANRHLFYGAKGEEKVINVLSTLPQNYIVINNYRLKFHDPIYDKRNDDRIYSIQIDHLVVGPTGIYLIETKNWSRDSIENLDLLSTIKQLHRHSFAMFVLLNQAIEEGGIRDLTNHWGSMKISPRNIVCMINSKPAHKFQYVTVLTLGEIANYILRQEQKYTQEALEGIVSYLKKIEKYRYA